jgi:hypothetical protein
MGFDVIESVMPAPVAGIHVLPASALQSNVDGWDKPAMTLVIT